MYKTNRKYLVYNKNDYNNKYNNPMNKTNDKKMKIIS